MFIPSNKKNFPKATLFDQCFKFNRKIKFKFRDDYHIFKYNTYIK